MGMYTGLRCRAKIKEKFYDVISDLHNEEPLDEEYDYDTWLWLNDKYPKLIPNINNWLCCSGHEHIPLGALNSMPPEFSKTGNEYSIFDKTTGIWEFCCSIRYGSETIENFAELILSKIAEYVDYCESLNEADLTEDNYPNPDKWNNLVKKHLIDFSKINIEINHWNRLKEHLELLGWEFKEIETHGENKLISLYRKLDRDMCCLALQLDIPVELASSISYLRTRSRHRDETEERLIRCYRKTGKCVSTISGEEDKELEKLGF